MTSTALLPSSSTWAIRRHTFTNPDRLSACPQFQADVRDTELLPEDFRILQKNRDHHSNLYGDYVDGAGNVVVKNVGVVEDPKPPGTYFRGAPMPYFMRIYSGVGMHAGYLPGVPDSHGCIRMPLRMAQLFYANAPSGTPVSVDPLTESDASQLSVARGCPGDAGRHAGRVGPPRRARGRR